MSNYILEGNGKPSYIITCILTYYEIKVIRKHYSQGNAPNSKIIAIIYFDNGIIPSLMHWSLQFIIHPGKLIIQDFN